MKPFIQILVMAGIVTPLLCLPVGLVLAVFCYAVFDIPFQNFLTFAGTFNRFIGLVAWWMLFFLPALAYAAVLLPGPKEPITVSAAADKRVLAECADAQIRFSAAAIVHA